MDVQPAVGAPPPGIEPQPGPETWRVDVLSNGMVKITIKCVTGEHVSFLPGQVAVDIGQNVTSAGRQASSGIIVPSPGTVIPRLGVNGNGGSPS